MLKIPYGKDLVVDFPLITAAGTEFAAAAPASGIFAGTHD